MIILNVEQMRQAEAAANAHGDTYEILMERAGQAVAAVLSELEAPARQRILILVGPGNNGGDGLVAGYYLRPAGADVCCYIWKRPRLDDPLLARARDAGCRLVWAEQDDGWAQLTGEAEKTDVVVDALLGTGADRPIEGMLAELLAGVRRCVEARRAPRAPAGGRTPGILDPLTDLPQNPSTPVVIAVDTPSGLNCDSGVADPATLPADVTVTLGFPKPGLFVFPAAGLVGKLLVADIGLGPYAPAHEPQVHLVTAAAAAKRLPARPLNAHKGTFGRALIIGGSVYYTGAPALAAQAAARVGAGLVTIALPDRIYPIVAAHQLEATYLLLPHSMGVLSPDALRVLEQEHGRYAAVLIGPGLSQEKEVAGFIHDVLTLKERMKMKAKQRGRLGFVSAASPAADAPEEVRELALPPLVLDADALNIMAQEEAWWEKLTPNCILTPHPGEMARLLKIDRAAVQADRLGMARRAAQDWKMVVVLKGAHTVVAAPDGSGFVLPFANPMLATAGTGDVLAGIIVGLLAQGLAPLDAAVAGAFVHGLAAEVIADEWEQGPGTIAGDLIAALPAALKRLL